MGDELARAAAEGNMVKLRSMLMKQDPKARKVQDAVVAAAAQNQFEVMKHMLEWRASPLSRDAKDTRAFIIACGVGSLDMVNLMIEHQADVNDRDKKNTPMTAAIGGPHLDVVKALITAGAEAPAECSVRGVGQAIWEARLETATKQMRNYADIQVSNIEITSAEDKVWAAMRDHMRLVEMKEEKAAGDQLAKYQKLTRSEEEESRKAQAKAQSLRDALSNNRVNLQKEQAALRELLHDIDGARCSHASLQEEDEKIRAEIQERKKELDEAQLEQQAATGGLRSVKHELDEMNAEMKACQEEIGDETRRRSQLEQRLENSEAELHGWLRDKEEAAELTAQAHRLLGR